MPFVLSNCSRRAASSSPGRHLPKAPGDAHARQSPRTSVKVHASKPYGASKVSAMPSPIDTWRWPCARCLPTPLARLLNIENHATYWYCLAKCARQVVEVAIKKKGKKMGKMCARKPCVTVQCTTPYSANIVWVNCSRVRWEGARQSSAYVPYAVREKWYTVCVWVCVCKQNNEQHRRFFVPTAWNIVAAYLVTSMAVRSRCHHCHFIGCNIQSVSNQPERQSAGSSKNKKTEVDADMFYMYCITCMWQKNPYYFQQSCAVWSQYGTWGHFALLHASVSTSCQRVALSVPVCILRTQAQNFLFHNRRQRMI